MLASRGDSAYGSLALVGVSRPTVPCGVHGAMFPRPIPVGHLTGPLHHTDCSLSSPLQSTRMDVPVYIGGQAKGTGGIG